jgi:predicted RNase H-like HicB family nuclease
MRYAVVIEKADGNYSAYVPDCRAASRPARR